MNDTAPKKKRGRPCKPENMRGINAWVVLPVAIVEQVDQMAKARFQSRNECLRGIITDYVLAKQKLKN